MLAKNNMNNIATRTITQLTMVHINLNYLLILPLRRKNFLIFPSLFLPKAGVCSGKGNSPKPVNPVV